MFTNIKHIRDDILLIHLYKPEELDVVNNGNDTHLVRLNFFDRLCNFFSGKGHDHRLEEYAKKTSNIFANYPWRFDKEQIRDFYVGGLSKWSFNLFDRSAIPEKLHALLRRILKKPFQDDPSCNYEEQQKLDKAVSEAELAIKLGIPPQKNKGNQGSIILLNHKRKPIGIFKDENPSSSFKTKLMRLFRTIFGFFKNHTIFLNVHNRAHAEVAASVADKVFDIGLVPLTRLVTIDGRRGSMQLWIDGMKEARSLHFENPPDQKTLTLFQTMAAYDFLFGNLDRHLENWLVGLKKSGNLEKIAMIDNGSAFPGEHPDDTLRDYPVRRNMYCWKNHLWSIYPFNKETLASMRKITKERIRRFVDKTCMALSVYGDPGDRRQTFLSKERIANLELRASLLQAMGSQDSPFAPHKLGQAYSSSRIHELLRLFKRVF